MMATNVFSEDGMTVNSPRIWRFLKSTPLVLHVFIAAASRCHGIDPNEAKTGARVDGDDRYRGVATGCILVLWGKNDVRTAIQQFYTPQKLLYPPKKNKFLATPLDR